ncbi:hypothetical protein JQ621_31660 [Bradyrhizobium manausense]|uniref:hypothetical protein n=1 Tax=Bradyrhizobium manausense TaxID=989370 RepID=UPI001BAD9A55|nr:hypothetical protein [Bradyrhizobium manausense]MBR1092035.1 hypothetical protein [Bradyrhizobium manausense]
MDLIFVCPRTDFKVQHRIDAASPRGDEYEAVTCPACTQLHFINLSTGMLLGQRKADAGKRL